MLKFFAETLSKEDCIINFDPNILTKPPSAEVKQYYCPDYMFSNTNKNVLRFDLFYCINGHTFKIDINSVPGLAEFVDSRAFFSNTGRDAAVKKLKKLVTDYHNKVHTFLHRMAEKGDISQLKSLLAEKPFLEGKNQYGATPLYLAVRNGHEQAAQLLLDAGANPNVALDTIPARDYTTKISEVYKTLNFTPLHCAASKQNRSMISILLKANARIILSQLEYIIYDNRIDLLALFLEKIDVNSFQLLHKAADYDRFEVFQFLIGKKADPNAKDNRKQTPLHCTRNLNIIKLLLSLNVDTNVQDDSGNTPLHLAIYGGNLEAVKLLLSANADPNIQNNTGQTPLNIAANSGLAEVAISIMESKSFKIEKFNFTLADHVFQAWEKQEWESKEKFQHYYKLIKSLLAKKVNPNNCYDKNKNTLLHYAVLSKDFELAQLAVLAGASVDAANIKGETALSKALDATYSVIRRRDLTEIIELFLQYKANPNIITRSGYTLLYWVAEEKKGDIKLVKLALAEQDHIEAKFQYGMTALHYAAKEGYVEMVRALLQAGANVEAMDNSGKLPINLAANAEIVNLLRSAKDKPFKTKENQQTYLKEQKTEELNNHLATIEISFNISPEELKKGRELGRGGFGVVFHGTYRHTAVAIKQLHSSQLTQDAMTEFQHEMKIMAKLRSPNIVRLHGITNKTPYCIVMEYCTKGDLYNFLHSQEKLSWEQRAKIALDIARGLAYLHKEHILHRDLKSKNVLLEDDFKAKIADFGLSKVKTETSSQSTSGKLIGTMGWMAPEIIEGESYTVKADIYSYGIMTWELSSRLSPHAKADGNQFLIAKWASAGKRDEIPHDTPKKFAEVMQKCWAQKPEHRPTADVIIEEWQEKTIKEEEMFSNAKSKPGASMQASQHNKEEETTSMQRYFKSFNS